MEERIKTCQGESVSVAGGNFPNSVICGDCPSAALPVDPASSGSIYDVIMVFCSSSC